ncbi:MAG TPA: hypothetical protein VHG32_19990 [Thermoanaerobaculia bacterium]|jgi:hypothetical protein|nr:hypothetical protein [Thermoanaerobaculia bacterium]
MSTDAQAACHLDRRRHWRLARLAAVALPLAGCRLDDLLVSDRQTFLWFLLPLVGFGLVGTTLIFYRRKRQLDEWDLRISAEEPNSRALVLTTFAVAAGITIAFATYNLFAVHALAPRQLMLNLAYWLAGTLAGGTVAVFVGRRAAEARR